MKFFPQREPKTTGAWRNPVRRRLVRVSALGGLLCLLTVGLALAESTEQTEEIFPSDPGTATEETPSKATRSYWRTELTLKVDESEEAAWLRLLLPLSDRRQTLVSRTISAEGFSLTEEPAGVNLEATLRRSADREGEEIRLGVAAEISDIRIEPSEEPFPAKKEWPRAIRSYLEPTEFIQSDSPKIRRQAKEIVRSAKRLDEALWALYQYTASFLRTSPETDKLDALSVLRENQGSGTGKARLLTALLRSVGIPARMVGGLRLEDASRTRSTISWVEAYVGDGWFPMDPTYHHFGFLPNRYLALYREDLPLIVHRAGLDVAYDIRVRQVTRKSLYESEDPTGAPVPSALVRPRVVAAEAETHTVASYVDRPVATVVILTDGRVPEAVIDRLRSEATEREINLILLMAPYQSRYFRETTLQELVAANVGAIREAHLLLIATKDDAGLYSLLALGERDIEVNDARVVVTGDFPRPVGTVLGAVLYELLDPGEMALFPEQSDLLSLWGVARANLIDGVPILEASRRWGIEANVIDPERFRNLSLYRKELIEGWARAVRARVPLQILTLILVLPVIAFVVVFFRNVIGISTFGTFSPVIVSLGFLATGIPWGVFIFLVIVGIGALLRNVLQRLRLHLVARLAILVGLVSALMAGLTVVGAYLGIGALLQVSLFPMIVMAALIENFTASQIEFGTRHAVRTAGNTLFVCIVCALVVEVGGLPSLILSYPELLTIVLVLDIALGKWRGLRLLELKRFYDLLRRVRPESQEGHR